MASSRIGSKCKYMNSSNDSMERDLCYWVQACAAIIEFRASGMYAVSSRPSLPPYSRLKKDMLTELNISVSREDREEL